MDSLSFTALGGTEALSARVVDGQGNAVPGASVTWSTSDAAVIEVTSDGVARSVGNGRATLTARADGATATIPGRVRQELAGVQVADETVSGNGVVKAPIPFTDPVDSNGHAIEGELARSYFASALVVDEQTGVPGFEPGATLDADSVVLSYVGAATLELAGTQATVTYEAAGAEIYAVEGPGVLEDQSELAFIGPRLDLWDPESVALDAQGTVELLGRAGDTVRVRLALEAAACSFDAGRLHFAAALPSRVPLTFDRAVGTPVAPELGALQLVDSGYACLDVAPGRYLVAFADMGYVERGKTELPGYRGWEDWTIFPPDEASVGFRVVDHVQGGSAAPSQAGTPAARPSAAFSRSASVAAPDHLQPGPFVVPARFDGTLPSIYQLTGPVTVGDRFLAPRDVTVEADPIELVPARVAYEREGFALVFHEMDDALLASNPEIMDEVQGLLDLFIDNGLAAFQDAFQIDYPRVGTPHGQHFLVVSLGVGGRYGWNAGFFTNLLASQYGDPDASWLAGGRILVHEVAHGFQFAVQADIASSRARAQWAVEGGAVLLETLAFELGAVDLDWWAAYPPERCGRWTACTGRNWERDIATDGAPAITLDGEGVYFGQTSAFLGDVSSWYFGYARSMSLMRRHARLLAEARGIPLEVAIGEVARESLGGFWGDLAGGSGPGLLGLMERDVPGFDPTVEHLTAILETTPRKQTLPMPSAFLWHDDTKRSFAMHLLAGLGTDFTLTTDRMSHGLFTYDVPMVRGRGLLELLPESGAMRYLVLRLE